MAAQVNSRKPSRFAAQMKSAPLGRDKIAGTEILKTFDRFFNIHMLGMHEPSGVVCGGRHKGIVNSWIFFANFPEALEIS